MFKERVLNIFERIRNSNIKSIHSLEKIFFSFRAINKTNALNEWKQSEKLIKQIELTLTNQNGRSAILTFNMVSIALKIVLKKLKY